MWISSIAQAPARAGIRPVSSGGAASGPHGIAASAAAKVRIGRKRLPPAKTLYRMASAIGGGHAGGAGRASSRAASISRRRASR